MYSRYSKATGGEIRLPENYSGCAFSVAPSPFPVAPPPHRDPPPTKKPTEAPPPLPPPPPATEEATEEPTALSLPPTHHPEGLLSRVTAAFDPDQLLILGLILLLLQSGEKTETVLWLMLLLFC